MTEVYGWHFARADRRLGHGDGRQFRKGQTLKVDGKPVLCEFGLHASPKALDALFYAPGTIACYVRLSGEIVGPTADHPDKMAATERTVIAWVDSTPILREFVRDTLAYSQPHIVSLFKKANMPEQAYAIEQVDMGAASFADIQAVFGTAWDAAWAAARDAARAAARDAAGVAARGDAWYAARDTAGVAARDAAVVAAWATSWATSRDAAWESLNAMLEARLRKAMGL